MRCLACGAEMHLMHVVQDETMLVPGYEHRTFMCSACGDIERRLVFARDIGQSPTEPVPVHTAPPISLAPDQQDRIPTSGILRRLFAKLRGNQVSVRPAPPMSPAEPVTVNTTAHSSVPSEASNDLYRLAALPRRAIEMCPGSTCHSQPTESLTDEGPRILAEPASSASVRSGAPTPVSCKSDKNLDECEALLSRAIEMVRGRTRSSQVETSVTQASSKTPSKSNSPSKSVSTVRVEGPPASRIVVQIHRDPQKAKYVAQDITSGLRILRHQDSARLRAMCDRMGWQVIEDGALKVNAGQD
jgi:hypothetical protein